MGDIFGGSDDGGAAAIAQANRDAALSSQQAEQGRWQTEQDRIAKDKSDTIAKQAADTQASESALALQNQQQQNQAAAQAVTGPSLDQTRLENAKLAAAAKNSNGSGLPGIDALRKKLTAPAAQSNSLLSQSGFNTGAVGGRRYV